MNVDGDLLLGVVREVIDREYQGDIFLKGFVDLRAELVGFHLDCPVEVQAFARVNGSSSILGGGYDVRLRVPA